MAKNGKRGLHFFMQTAVLFDGLNQVFSTAGVEMDAAEAHGVICGALTQSTTIDDTTWLPLILEDVDPASEAAKPCASILRQLKTFTVDGLNSPDCKIALVLPPDNQPLTERAAALGRWCQGFLYGLGVALGQAPRRMETPEKTASPPAVQPRAEQIWKDLSPTAQEFIRDVQAITRVDANASDELAYAEVVEYLRAGLLLLREE